MFLQDVVLLVMVAWFFHGLSLLSSLMAKKPKANVGGILVVLFILIGNVYGALSVQLSRLEADSTLAFFGAELPWLLFAALYLLSALMFLLIASTRKMRSDLAHALSKIQATACLLTLTVLLLGGLWAYLAINAPLALVVLYILVVASLMMAITITPTAGEYAKGLRRAERQGRKHLSSWNDLALNRVVLGGFCLIVLVGSTVAWNITPGHPRGVDPQGEGRLSLAIAVGVLVVAYFGLAYQFFCLVTPKRPGTMMCLFLFLAWIVPMLAGVITRSAGMNDAVPVALFSLSPIAGLSTSAGATPPDLAQVAQIAALMPAIVFAFLFNNLVVIYRRRVESSLGEAMPPKVEMKADPLMVG